MQTEIEKTQPFYNKSIPSDWGIRRFDEVCDIDKHNLKGNTAENYHFDYISLSDVDSDDFKIETTKQIFKTAPSRARRIVHFRDILMSTVRPNLRGFVHIKHKPENLIASTGFAVISCEKINDEYLYHYLFSSFIDKQFYQLLVGSNYPAINSSDVKKLKIPFPPPIEQQKIAKVLGSIDDVINITSKLVAKKEKNKKWLMQQLLSGKKRLKGFEKEWQIISLGNFIKESRVPSRDNDVNKRITVKLNLKGIEKRDVRGSEAEDATYYFIRKAGQFIYGKQNLHKGAFGIIPKELDGFESSQDIPSFDFYGEIEPLFLLFFFSLENIHKSLEKISTGTGSKRIHPENLFKVKYKFPEKIEQTAIANILEIADKEIKLLKEKVEKLKEQKKGMMQVLLTGKKRLK